MKKDDLVAKAKIRIRKMSTDILDEDVGQLVEVALADLKRIGVDGSYLGKNGRNINDPLITEAVLMYCKANFGTPDNQEKLMAAYEMMCTKIKGGGYHRSVD